MLEIQFGKNQYWIPDQWDELNEDQFVYLVNLLTRYFSGDLTHEMVRTLYFLKVAGIQSKKIRKTDQADQFAENVYRISRQLTFMFRVVYENSNSLQHLDKDLKTLLQRYLPEELDQDLPEIRAISKLKKHIEVDAVFAKNLVSVIRIGNNTYSGYRFDRIGDILETDLPAGDFITASTLYDQYKVSGNDEHLKLLITALYKLPDGVAGKIPAPVCDAILFNFRAILQFLNSCTQYGILWQSGSSQTGEKISIGFVDSLYTLSKAGYGDAGYLRSISVVEFLDLLLKEVIDTVKTLKQSKMDPVKIAEATKLSIDQVLMII